MELVPQTPALRTLEENERFDVRVLLADDEESVRNMLFWGLVDRYVEVKAVANGEELLEKLTTSDQNYNTVITDINMGEGIDGVELLRRIHSISKFEKLLVIVLTGGNLEKKEEIESLGGVYMEKPLPSIDDLCRKIEELTQAKVIKVPPGE